MSSLPSYKSKRSQAQVTVMSVMVMLFAFFLQSGIVTQWFAHQYRYDTALGEALIRLNDFYIYAPYLWVQWGWEYSSLEAAKTDAHIILIWGVGSSIVSILSGFVAAFFLTKNNEGMAGLHGNAHWAEFDDINNKGFLPDGEYKSKGVVIGSVMLDKKNQVIHPFHPGYKERQVPDVIRGKNLKYFQVKQKRNGEGELLFKPNQKIIKKIELLRDAGNTHIYAFCPTRSGKGVALITPTLLTWEQSVFVNDSKAEAYSLTAGFRQSAGQYIIKFEPACTDGTGACWNPLDEIRIFSHFDVQDAQMIMTMLCDPDGKGLEGYFDKAAFAFLMGLALHMRYAESNGSLEGIAMFLGDPRWDSDKQMYQHMMDTEHDPELKMGWKDTAGKPTKTHPVVANTGQTMMNKEDKDRSGVLSTAQSLLSLYLDPIVAKNTARSDFLVRDIMTSTKPVSLYYVTSPADMERLRPLTRLFYALFIRRNAAEMKFENGKTAKSYTFSMLMIIDEMISLKKMPILEEALSYVAGYGIRMFLLSQDITQVESEYGDKQSIDSGAATRIVYAPNKIETAEKLARMTGKTTILEEKTSQSFDKLGIKPGSVSVNFDKIGRDLMTAEEFLMLSYSDMVIFIAGQPPIYGRKGFFYENPVMVSRTRIAPPAKSDVLRIGANIIAVKKDGENKVKDPSLLAWEKDQEELTINVRKGLDGVGIMSSGKEEVILEDRRKGASTTTRIKSRYSDSVDVVSSDDRKKIATLLASVALRERVSNISAF